MNKTAMVVGAVLGPIILMLAVVGVVSLFSDDDNANTNASTEEGANQDQPESELFSDDAAGQPDSGDEYSTFPWNQTSNPVNMGITLNRFLDRDGLEQAKNRELQAIFDEIGDNEPTEQQLQAVADIQDQLLRLEFSPYLTDEDVSTYLNPENAGIYLEFRNEYFDDDGNQIKDPPVPRTEEDLQ